MLRRVSVALAGALLLVGCLVEDPPAAFGPEFDAVAFIAVRDGQFAEPLDAEALLSAVHPDITAQTSRSKFIDCFFASADRPPPPEPFPTDAEISRDLWSVALHRGKVPSDNVLTKDGDTYSVVDRRDDRGITSLDVRVEGPQGASITTVLLTSDVEDPHDPGGSSRYWGVGAGGQVAVVGTVPDDPCLVGGEEVRERLQTTGLISVGRQPDQGPLPELIDYRVLAVVWTGAPDDRDLVGGAFWWMDDEGTGGDGVHPPSDGDTAGDVEDDLELDDPDVPEEPRRAPDWVARAFEPAEAMRFAPGTYTIEVWADPSGLFPSANPRVPAETVERNCTMEIEVTAGTHLTVSFDDIPTGGGECPHETEFQSGL